MNSRYKISTVGSTIKHHDAFKRYIISDLVIYFLCGNLEAEMFALLLRETRMFTRETNTITDSEEYKTQVWNPNYFLSLT